MRILGPKGSEKDGSDTRGDNTGGTEGNETPDQEQSKKMLDGAARRLPSYAENKAAGTLEVGKEYRYDADGANNLEGKPILITAIEQKNGNVITSGRIDMDAKTVEPIPKDFTLELNDELVKFDQFSPKIDRNQTNTEKLNEKLSEIVNILNKYPNAQVLIDGTTHGVWPPAPLASMDPETSAINGEKDYNYYAFSAINPKPSEKDLNLDISKGDSKTLAENRSKVIGNQLIRLGLNKERISATAEKDMSKYTVRAVRIHVKF